MPPLTPAGFANSQEIWSCCRSEELQKSYFCFSCFEEVSCIEESPLNCFTTWSFPSVAAGDVFPGSCVNQMKREQLFLRACVAGKKWAGISQNCKLPRILGRKEATYTGLTDNLSPDWGTRKSVSKQSREISRRGFSDPGHSHCKGPDSSPQKRSRQAEPEIGCQLGGKPDRRKGRPDVKNKIQAAKIALQSNLRSG